MASLRTSVEHLIRNIDEFVLARVRRYLGKSIGGRFIDRCVIANVRLIETANVNAAKGISAVVDEAAIQIVRIDAFGALSGETPQMAVLVSKFDRHRNRYHGNA